MRIARWGMVVLVSLIGCGLSVSAQAPKAKAVDDGRDRETDEVIAAFLASPAMAAVRGAERIEALPIEESGAGLSATFKVVERPVVLDARTMREVRDRVTRTRSYLGGPVACMFQPGLALRFHKGGDWVQMLICFLCGEVRFEDSSGRALDDKYTFDEDAMRLGDVARKAFPNNPAFQRVR